MEQKRSIKMLSEVKKETGNKFNFIIPMQISISCMKFVWLDGVNDLAQLPSHPISGIKTIVMNNMEYVDTFGGPSFPDVENVFFIDCNGLFVYYWLNSLIFPSMKNVYFNTNPNVFEIHGIMISGISYYLTAKWCDGMNYDGYIEISDEEFNKRLNSLR